MNLDGIIYLIIAIMFGPAILLAIIALLLRKNNKKAAKVLFILAAVYVIVSLGICGSMIAG
jgi:heme O synthase-like polyprenyltransferase